MEDQWIEIFKTGAHTAGNGVSRHYTTSDLDEIVSNYKPDHHEAPVVIGHPKENAPAYGWVKAVKRNGDRLLAKLHQLDSDFKEMVRSGRFKKRSISLGRGNTLRHVGFLGAVAPAIKGLKEISAFSAGSDEEECLSFEQCEEDLFSYDDFAEAFYGQDWKKNWESNFPGVNDYDITHYV